MRQKQRNLLEKVTKKSKYRKVTPPPAPTIRFGRVSNLINNGIWHDYFLKVKNHPFLSQNSLKMIQKWLKIRIFATFRWGLRRKILNKFTLQLEPYKEPRKLIKSEKTTFQPFWKIDVHLVSIWGTSFGVHHEVFPFL